MRTALKFVLAACLSAAALSPLPGADWPRWNGPAGTGVSAEKGLLATWPKDGPKLVWSSKVAGNGFAGLAVVGGNVYTMGAFDGEEFAIALDSQGKKLWSTKIGPVHDWKGNQWSRGPNATPTVDGDLVYCLSSKGDLLCCEKTNGAKVWSKNLPKDYSAQIVQGAGGVLNFGWGFSWSPIVDGDQLVLTPGGPKGLFAALDKKTGKTIWQSKGITYQALYSTPTIATIGGVKQYITITQHGVSAVSADKGDLLWDWKRGDEYPDVICTSPIVVGNLVYVSVGENGGYTTLKIAGSGGKFSATEAHSGKAIANRQGGVVLVGKYLYGYHEDRAWMCQNFATGKIEWGQKGRQSVKVGSVLAADGKLYILSEAGIVAMLEASPKGYKELGKFDLPTRAEKAKPSAKVWTHPSLSDGKLYLRDQELVFCYEVK
jgi:outer membrane protein assembly factor BamB